MSGHRVGGVGADGRWLFWLRLGLFALVGAGAAVAAQAHGTKAGDLRIEHPYATPTLPGQTTGAVYFRAIENTGAQPDELLAARTTVAATAELHHMEMAGDVMRMRALPTIVLPPQTELRLRHGSGAQPGGSDHIMLRGLKAPLKDGDRFALVLTFKRAGEREVMVWVQTPKGAAADTQHAH